MVEVDDWLLVRKRRGRAIAKAAIPDPMIIANTIRNNVLGLNFLLFTLTRLFLTESTLFDQILIITGDEITNLTTTYDSIV